MTNLSINTKLVLRVHDQRGCRDICGMLLGFTSEYACAWAPERVPALHALLGIHRSAQGATCPKGMFQAAD